MIYTTNLEPLFPESLYSHVGSNVQLPLPEKFYSTACNNHYESLPASSSMNFADGDKQIIEDFIRNSSNLHNSGNIHGISGCFSQTRPEAFAVFTLNQVSASVYNWSTLLQIKDSQPEVNSPSSRATGLGNFGKVISTHDGSESISASDVANCTRVPTKEELYLLSTIIQNTNPEFENAGSEELKDNVDSHYVSKSGLFISKKLAGFEWAFEIFFEKHKGTNRNRRQLRCKHDN